MVRRTSKEWLEWMSDFVHKRHGKWPVEANDLISNLADLEAELATLKEVENARLCAIIDTIGGTVEGHPTCELDYLQRLRELVGEERELAEVRGRLAGLVEATRDYFSARSEDEAVLAEERIHEIQKAAARGTP